MGLMDAFKALEDVVDEVVEEKKVNKTLKESVETINISGDDMYEKGKAYYYAHTGDTVTLDDESKKYMIIQDKEGKHKIGYSDVLLLKDLDTGEEIEISKKDFISKAQLVKECVTESQENYYVLSDGKNPKHSHVYGDIDDVDGFISSLEDTKTKGNYGYWELLHYVNGNPTKLWSTEEGKIKVESCKEGCDLKEEPTYDLGTQFDSRQSFYGKAKVDVRPDGSQVLYSYGSPVCQIKDGKAYLLVHVNGYASYASSQTTLRHVKEFLKQNGFKADSLKQMEKDYPIQRNSFVESLKLTESEAIDLNNEEEVKKGKEILTKKEEEQPEQIVDVDADTIDKIKDSYLGNAILQCPVCRTLIYKKPDVLVKDEETQLYNVKEACPHCGSEDGYELVGQVASLDVPVPEPEQTTGVEEVETETEVEVKEPEEKPERAPRALAAMGEPEQESLEIKELNEEKFDKLINKYAIATYNNVESYKTTGGKIVEDTGEIILEGVVKYTSGKEAPVTFKFVEKALTKGGKCKLTGICEKFAKDKKAYVMVGSIKEGYLTPESMSYNYSVNVLEESKTIRGRVNLKKEK